MAKTQQAAKTRTTFLVLHVEVHLSNIHAREPFRHRTFNSDLADFALDFALKAVRKGRS